VAAQEPSSAPYISLTVSICAASVPIAAFSRKTQYFQLLI